MAKQIFLVVFFICFHVFAYSEKTYYNLKNEPIDVVIVAHPKDQETLDDCIDGIRENGGQIGRVIVVSATKLSDKAEWFNEEKFPFSKEQIIYTIGKGNKKKIAEFKKQGMVGWYLQQLLKLYASFVIPDISSNVLVLDADTIFMNPVEFLNPQNGAFFCFKEKPPGSRKKAYFQHAQRFLPDYRTMSPYPVCHHMLFQRAILKDLFETVEKYHGTSLWKAFCLCVDLDRHPKAASEYEIYYNFAFRHTDQVALRPLRWTTSADLDSKEQLKMMGYHFVTFHTFLRDGIAKQQDE